MRPIQLLALLLLAITAAFGQDSHQSLMDSEWSIGSVFLADGGRLNGLVKYNDKLRFIAWQPYNNRDVSKVFREDEVTAVELFDQRAGKRRKLLSLVLRDNETGEEQIMLFELLKVFSDFAVLLRKEPVVGLNAAYRGSPFYPLYELPLIYASNSNGAPFIDQKEIIYFVNDEGCFEVYYRKSKTDRRMGERFADKDLLKKYTTGYYDAVKDYARRNKLVFTDTDDLVRMLDYYELMRTESASEKIN